MLSSILEPIREGIEHLCHGKKGGFSCIEENVPWERRRCNCLNLGHLIMELTGKKLWPLPDVNSVPISPSSLSKNFQSIPTNPLDHDRCDPKRRSIMRNFDKKLGAAETVLSKCQEEHFEARSKELKLDV